MTTKVQNYFEEKVIWKQGVDSNYPYEVEFNGEKLVIRLNDFPDENLYTLIVNNVEVASFDDWPEQWTKSRSQRQTRLFSEEIAEGNSKDKELGKH